MAAASVRLVPRAPSVEELRRLATAIGWLDHYDWSTVGGALSASVDAIVAVDGDAVVGTARVVGDGSHYFYLQDVLVDPEHQDEGLASRMVAHLLRTISRRASSAAFVGLFSSPEAIGVYEELGFERPDDMTAMRLAPDGPSR